MLHNQHCFTDSEVHTAWPPAVKTKTEAEHGSSLCVQAAKEKRIFMEHNQNQSQTEWIYKLIFFVSVENKLKNEK